MYNGGSSSSSSSSASYAWDYDNDGHVSGNDLLNQFDVNRDGILDRNEIQLVGEQLSKQLDYNNALLVRIHS
jgi:hypothetical protein